MLTCQDSCSKQKRPGILTARSWLISEYQLSNDHARTLLETLKREKLVLDWRKKQQAKADVQVTIDQMLDRLPPSYTQEVYLQLCTEVFQHVYESYFGQGKSVYALAS